MPAMIGQGKNEATDQEECQHGLETRDEQVERRVSKCPTNPTGNGVRD